MLIRIYNSSTCIQICILIYTHIYKYIFIYKHICVYIYVYIDLYHIYSIHRNSMYTQNFHTPTHPQITAMLVLIYDSSTYIQICLHIYTHAYIIYIYIYVYISVYIFVYMYLSYIYG